MARTTFFIVIVGLGPATHGIRYSFRAKSWMAGTGPTTTM